MVCLLIVQTCKIIGFDLKKVNKLNTSFHNSSSRKFENFKKFVLMSLLRFLLLLYRSVEVVQLELLTPGIIFEFFKVLLLDQLFS